VSRLKRPSFTQSERRNGTAWLLYHNVLHRTCVAEARRLDADDVYTAALKDVVLHGLGRNTASGGGRDELVLVHRVDGELGKSAARRKLREPAGVDHDYRIDDLYAQTGPSTGVVSAVSASTSSVRTDLGKLGQLRREDEDIGQLIEREQAVVREVEVDVLRCLLRDRIQRVEAARGEDNPQSVSNDPDPGKKGVTHVRWVRMLRQTLAIMSPWLPGPAPASGSASIARLKNMSLRSWKSVSTDETATETSFMLSTQGLGSRRMR
jgi:hypothetical protein